MQRIITLRGKVFVTFLEHSSYCNSVCELSFYTFSFKTTYIFQLKWCPSRTVGMSMTMCSRGMDTCSTRQPNRMSRGTAPSLASKQAPVFSERCFRLIVILLGGCAEHLCCERGGALQANLLHWRRKVRLDHVGNAPQIQGGGNRATDIQAGPPLTGTLLHTGTGGYVTHIAGRCGALAVVGVGRRDGAGRRGRLACRRESTPWRVEALRWHHTTEVFRARRACLHHTFSAVIERVNTERRWPAPLTCTPSFHAKLQS